MEVKREVHYNIKDTYNSWNAWKPDFTFPLGEVDETFLSKIQLDETIYKSTILGEDIFNYDLIVNEISGLIKSYESSYLFTFGHKVSKKSKLRSYKGLLHNLKTKIENYSKFELDLTNNSILGTSINLKEINNFDLEELVFELPNTYIILSRLSNLFNSFEGEKLMKDTLYISGDTSYLNFYKTLSFWFSNYQNKDIEVMRLGGNGNSEISIQRFYLITPNNIID